MQSSLRSLLDGVVDYAGIYPPAMLDLPVALANFVRYSEGPEAWFISRFACPATRLEELVEALDLQSFDFELPVTILGHVAEDLDEWEEGLERDIKEINAFVVATDDRVAVEAYEVRIPSHLHTEVCVRDLRSFQDIDVFVELPWGDGLDDSLAAIAQTEWLGAKARVGGTYPEAFPSPTQLAEFIRGAVALDLPFKFSEGLHHPLPIVDSASGIKMHGFLNVLAASAFALAQDLSRSEIEGVLRSDTISDWSFGNEKLKWRGLSLSLDEIDDGRSLCEAIGSSSVKEPLDGLDRLGLMAGAK